MRSCNCFYYQYGNDAGIRTIKLVNEKFFHLGETTGIPVLNEKPGRVPDDNYHRSLNRGNWSSAHTANVSIGQGDVEATPLQMASVTATIASGGLNFQPRLLYKKASSDGDPIAYAAKLRENFAEPSESRGNHVITRDQMEIIRQGMWDVVNTSGGTAGRARSELVGISGKTGTAQFKRNGQPDNKTWFIAFAPFDKPSLAVCVMVEGGKAGGTVAAPIAKKVIEETIAMREKGFKVEVTAVEESQGNFDFNEFVSFDPTIPAEVFAAAANEDDGSAVAPRTNANADSTEQKRQLVKTAPTITKAPDKRGTTNARPAQESDASRFPRLRKFFRGNE